MVDIVGAVNMMRQPGPINMLSGIEGLKAQRAQNQLVQQQMSNDEALRNALAGGDVSAINALSPQMAGLYQNVMNTQKREAGLRLMAKAERIAGSPNAPALWGALSGNPETVSDLQEWGISLDGSGVEGLNAEDVQRQAAEIAQALKTQLTGVSSGSGVQSKFITPQNQLGYLTSDGRVVVTDQKVQPSTALERRGADAEMNARLLQVEQEQAAARAAGGAGGLNLTPGQKAVDNAFAQEYVAWTAAGGFADVEKNIQQLAEVEAKLQSGANVTGGFIGKTPRFVLAKTNPEALNTLEQVEEVVQRNLRLILGAQFTEKEGERLIARAYNPDLEEPDNLSRVKRLMASLTRAAQAKQDAADYYAQNGTLAKYTGEVPTIDSILKDAKLDDVYEQARDAIRRGAPPDAVRQRLQEAGYDPEQL